MGNGDGADLLPEFKDLFYPLTMFGCLYYQILVQKSNFFIVDIFADHASKTTLKIHY
jgi:hypothetical protein